MQTLDNRMELTLRRRAWWPFVKTLSARGFHSNTPTWIESANDAARSLAKKIDGFPMSSVTEVLFNIPLTAHILGGCIMGADPDHGVVDSQCRVHGYDNMYIVDGSMIPANLGVNPSLTITAMAEYAMSRITRKES
jgi:cholesterol oxidase